ncbi:Crp/Fnr family transcriptional regulator [Actinomadura syzygii]|uniref:Cyclic nucleotide-binding domain-containing protein n=1 Tax=Actinomadura syzygii TaxID=1427538 RepID=A0A5D0TWR4_9ACTN|nr:cyclic nucleotide-binding domain-containing protein [Actinomadura syzygii]TYC10267.1 cyclic nucleotide-binding domain-containing protein [Actinomadura syzygii]
MARVPAASDRLVGVLPDFLSMFSAAERADLLRRGLRRIWPARTTLFRQDEDDTTVVIVLSGEVEVGSGADDRPPQISGPGSLLGAVSALGRRPRSATAVATTSVQGAVLPVEEFEGFLLSHRSDTAFQFLRILCERFARVDVQPP